MENTSSLGDMILGKEHSLLRNQHDFDTESTETSAESNDPVNHPKHYTQHPSGVECIDITEHFNFNLGNAIKYIWRAGDKGDLIQDLEKARWYLDREIERLTK